MHFTNEMHLHFAFVRSLLFSRERGKPLRIRHNGVEKSAVFRLRCCFAVVQEDVAVITAVKVTIKPLILYLRWSRSD